MLNTDDLRHYTGIGTGYSPEMMMQRAADEIERLRAAEAEAVECLHRIVNYYDDPRCGSDYLGLPGLDMQAKAKSEATMFGAARVFLSKRHNMNVTGAEPRKDTNND